MPVSYDRLWKRLIDNKMNRSELTEAAGIGFNVLARIGKDEPVSLESLEKICHTLSCDIGEVMEITTETTPTKKFTTIELFAGAGGMALGLNKLALKPSA